MASAERLHVAEAGGAELGFGGEGLLVREIGHHPDARDGAAPERPREERSDGAEVVESGDDGPSCNPGPRQGDAYGARLVHHGGADSHSGVADEREARRHGSGRLRHLCPGAGLGGVTRRRGEHEVVVRPRVIVLQVWGERDLHVSWGGRGKSRVSVRYRRKQRVCYEDKVVPFGRALSSRDALVMQVRTLFINDTARNGGPGRSLHAVLKFLDPKRVHRTVVLPRGGAIAELLSRDGVVDDLLFEPNLVENPIEPLRRPMERRDFDAPVPVKGARLVANAGKVALALVRLAAVVRRGRFDLVYCNGTNADFVGGALAALTGVPALWHVRYSSLPGAVVGLHRRLSSSRGVRRIVCVSRAAARQFRHCAEKVRVIHNGLDVDRFDPGRVRPLLREELGLPEDAIVFGSHGRVLRRKGYVELAKAARVALQELTADEGARVVFVVVGDTPEDFRIDHARECRELSLDLGIGDRFRWLGFRADVRPLVAGFDVAVVPSVYADPLPRSVIESMALAKAVVAFDVGGVAEMVCEATGTLVPFEPAHGGAEGASEASVRAMADAFVRYVRDPALRHRQGRAARERALRDYDARQHARVIENEIHDACAARGGELVTS